MLDYSGFYVTKLLICDLAPQFQSAYTTVINIWTAVHVQKLLSQRLCQQPNIKKTRQPAILTNSSAFYSMKLSPRTKSQSVESGYIVIQLQFYHDTWLQS